MSADRRRPPSLTSNVRPDPELRTITFRMVDKQMIGTRVTAAKAEELATQLNADGASEAWHRLNDPSGVTVLLNPAHIVSMEIR